jgi:hypothetical protein
VHLSERWADVRRVSRRRLRSRLDDVAYAVTVLAEGLGHQTTERSWRLSLGETSLPDPAFLLRRVLAGEDPDRQPPLPRQKIRRRPLCLVPGFDQL